MTAYLDDLLRKKIVAERFITTQEAKHYGWSKQTLQYYTQHGLLKRLQHGVYSLPKYNIDPLLLIQLRSHDIIFSHDAAAYIFKLIKTAPKKIYITLPSNKTVPRTIKEQVICHYVKTELHKIGIDSIKIYGNSPMSYINIYSRERTICDFLRDCPDKKKVLSIIKAYGEYANWEMYGITEIAKEIGIENKLEEYKEHFKSPEYLERKIKW